MYYIVKGYLEKVNVTPEYIVKTNEKNPHDLKLIDVLPEFYREIFTSFNECKKTLFRKFYGRYGDLTKQYEVPLSRMLHDILDDDHTQ